MDFAVVFQSLTAAYVVVRNKVVAEVSDGYIRALGQPRERLVGVPFRDGPGFRFISRSAEGEVWQLEAADDAHAFISIATHELRTPIAAMLLRLQRLRRTLAKAESAAAAEVDAILRQLSRLTRLVDNLLDVSRLRNGKLQLDVEALDLCGVVDDVVERLADVARAAGSEVRVTHRGNVVGYWDRMRLEQVLTNLITNALKYGGGRPVQVAVTAPDDLACVVVHDDGIGIAPADHERIFERFERSTTAHADASLGLGLYIARELVRAHGGAIRVESEIGKGATFVVELPRHRIGSEDGARES